MKNQVLNILVFLFITSASFANNNPETGMKLLDNQKVFVSLSNADQSNIFSTVNYNVQDKNIEFETNEDISHVQIFNSDGALEFQLLVDSNKVKLGKSLFGEGDYKLGFIIDGADKVQFTNVTVK